MGDMHSTDAACSNSTCGKLTFIASVLVLVLFIINCSLMAVNRGAQEDVIARQTELGQRTTKIQQNATFDNINRSLIQALAAAAITKKDEQIKALLIQNNVNLNPPKEGEAGAPVAPKK